MRELFASRCHPDLDVGLPAFDRAVDDSRAAHEANAVRKQGYADTCRDEAQVIVEMGRLGDDPKGDSRVPRQAEDVIVIDRLIGADKVNIGNSFQLPDVDFTLTGEFMTLGRYQDERFTADSADYQSSRVGWKHDQSYVDPPLPQGIQLVPGMQGDQPHVHFRIFRCECPEDTG